MTKTAFLMTDFNEIERITISTNCNFCYEITSRIISRYVWQLAPPTTGASANPLNPPIAAWFVLSSSITTWRSQLTKNSDSLLWRQACCLDWCRNSPLSSEMGTFVNHDDSKHTLVGLLPIHLKVTSPSVRYLKPGWLIIILHCKEVSMETRRE